MSACDGDPPKFLPLRKEATPPDSGEREVQPRPMDEWLEQDCPSLDTLCPICVADLLAIEKGLKAQIEHWRYLAVRGVGSDATIVPLPLAQRILAALETQAAINEHTGFADLAQRQCALADELRKEMGK